jgi:hypothetical protein
MQPMSEKPVDYYVTHPAGLCPAALPRTAPTFPDVLERFHFLGVFVAKSLQDERLVYLPLSTVMFKMMCGQPLVMADVLELHPATGHFLFELQAAVAEARQIRGNHTLTNAEREAAVATVQVRFSPGSVGCAVEDLGLTFVWSPPSTVYGFAEVELRAGGAEEELTLANAEEYIQLTTEFLLESGIRGQLDAFSAGFQEVCIL